MEPEVRDEIEADAREAVRTLKAVPTGCGGELHVIGAERTVVYRCEREPHDSRGRCWGDGMNWPSAMTELRVG